MLMLNIVLGRASADLSIREGNRLLCPVLNGGLRNHFRRAIGMMATDRANANDREAGDQPCIGINKVAITQTAAQAVAIRYVGICVRRLLQK